MIFKHSHTLSMTYNDSQLFLFVLNDSQYFHVFSMILIQFHLFCNDFTYVLCFFDFLLQLSCVFFHNIFEKPRTCFRNSFRHQNGIPSSQSAVIPLSFRLVPLVPLCRSGVVPARSARSAHMSVPLRSFSLNHTTKSRFPCKSKKTSDVLVFFFLFKTSYIIIGVNCFSFLIPMMIMDFH